MAALGGGAGIPTLMAQALRGFMGLEHAGEQAQQEQRGEGEAWAAAEPRHSQMIDGSHGNAKLRPATIAP